MAARLFTDDSLSIQQPSPRTSTSRLFPSSPRSECTSSDGISRQRDRNQGNDRLRSPVNIEEDDSEDESPSHPTDAADSVGKTTSSGAVRRFLRHRRGQIRSRRFPTGRASLLVFVLIIAERYVFYGAVDGVLRLIPGLTSKSGTGAGFGSFVRIFLYYCIGRLFYPVGGFLADVYLGRYRVIHISLWLYWIAFAFLAIANVLRMSVSASTSVIHNEILPIFAYVLIVLASGGFESTIIPFGADQLEAAGSSELSSYFYWFKFSVQIGILGNVLVTSVVSLILPEYLVPILHVLITLVVTTAALVLHKNLEHWYFKNVLRENCIKMVSKVLSFAATVKRHQPQYRRAFRYSEGRLPRIELAKQQYDGKFTGDQVEDVKTFCRICFILFSIGGFLFSLSGVSVIMSIIIA